MSDLYRDSVDYLLVEWGKAARESLPKLNYQPQFLGKAKGSTVKSATISTADYELVDLAVSSLILDEPLLHDVCCMIYIHGYTYSVISRVLKCSKSTVSARKMAILDHVGNCLNFKGG